MNDAKLEERKESFQRSIIQLYLFLVNTDIVSARQNHKLSLRKEKIDEFIQKRREKLSESRGEISRYEIIQDSLILQSDVLNRNFPHIVYY